MIELSVVIITFNEEKNIGRCLESVKGIADEIVVVDSFSTDSTKKICQGFGVRFFEQPFGGYIEQKQQALERASGRYVLCLDADESLSDDLKRSIQEEKSRGFSHPAYSMNRRNNYCDQWIRFGTYYPDRKIRLFDRQAGAWGGVNPHDKVILHDGIKPIQLNGDLLHYTYQSYNEHGKKMERFSSIAAEELFKKGKPASYFKLLVNPAWGFFYAYFIRRGFLDGKNGFMIARLNAWQKYLKYKKLILLHKSQ